MNTIEQLESQRSELILQIAAVGEFRPGNLSPVSRKCGNPKCRCAQPDGAPHRGWQLTRKIKGRSQCRSVPRHALDDTQGQVDEYRRFRDLVDQFTEVNERLCEQRLKLRRGEKKTPGRRRT